jgi:hypothetical protein
LVKVFANFLVSNEGRLRRVVGMHRFRAPLIIPLEKWAYGRTSKSIRSSACDPTNSAQASLETNLTLDPRTGAETDFVAPLEVESPAWRFKESL